MFFLPFLAAAAIGAAGSVISAASQRSAAQEQQDRIEAENRRVEAANAEEQRRVTSSNRQMAAEYANTDIAARLVKEAEGSGFNPLTLVRAGGLSAYTSLYNQASGSSLEYPNYRTPAPQVYIPGAGEGLGAAFSAVSSAVGSYASANAQHVSSSRLMQQQLQGNLILQGARGAISGSGGKVAVGSPALSTAAGRLAASLPYPQSWEQGDVNRTNPWYNRLIDPAAADGQALEDRYSDFWGSVFATDTVIADGLLNLTGRDRIDRQNSFRQNQGIWESFWGGISRNIVNSRSSVGTQASPHFGQFQPGMGGW